MAPSGISFGYNRVRSFGPYGLTVGRDRVRHTRRLLEDASQCLFFAT
jgi:hypothetical protein